eukprot:4983241-Alexandrium_andersonii.AAC.1
MALREVARGAELDALLLQAAAPEGAHFEVDVVVEAPSDLRPAPRGGRAWMLERQVPSPRRADGEDEGRCAQAKDVAPW